MRKEIFLYLEEIQKKQREGEKLITKTLFCDAAKAANVYSSKSQKRVARYRAVLESAS